MLCKQITLLFALALNVDSISGYKILGLFPFSGGSNVAMFLKIMRGLAARGHEVHVLSHYPLKAPMQNYTDLSVLGSLPLPTSSLPLQMHDGYKYDVFNLLDLMALYEVLHEHADVMKSETVQKLLKSNERYDLIMTESFVTDMFLGFVHKFKAPFILLSSCIPPPWTSSLVANPQNPAFTPHFNSRSPQKMTFLQRVANTYGLIVNLAAWHWIFAPANQRIMNQHFGEDMPPLVDIAKNASLVLSNAHSSIYGGRPLASNVIEVGGVHIETAKKLPNDIEKFIKDSEHGVIYFCLGSLLRGATLPEQKRKAFLDAFSQLKERILWKFEDDSFTTSSNILVKEWMPQRDILAHPKVKLFISHGGLLGSLEAISEGKPILGIPFFGDQHANIRSLELQGAAKYFDYGEIESNTLLQAIREMLKPKYAENAKRVQKIFHDRPMSPMDTSIYWIEYVIRNGGAKNLRSVGADLPTYQYLLIDVIAFFVFCASATVYLINYTLKLLFCQKKVPKSAKKKFN